ncbi:MAG: hypothetical protein HC866_14760 [Leptolyngbyaceae cyanobacterium RU_5_1]|nr:hypothetical protein [Leptolyngbyaceae cyanobacterium RU_5_1]
MKTCVQLRLAAVAAVALGFFSSANSAIAAPGTPGSVVVPTLPVYTPSTGGAFTPPRSTTPPSRFPSIGNPSRLPPLPTVQQPSQRPTYGSPGSPASQQPINGRIYRVIVPDSTDVAQEQVKTIVPGAFRTIVNGRPVIQAGVFREERKASELQQALYRNNLQATVIPANEVTSTQPPRSNLPSDPLPSNPLPSVPKTGIVVVIDPGHGGGDPGAVGIGGLREAETVLDISRQVVSLLKQQGIQAVLTRQSDQEIELGPRVQFAERANADVFVSIHANAFDANRTDVNGVETYYHSSAEGKRLARVIQDNLLQGLGARDRGVKQANFYVIRYTTMPAALVEIGFVTGQEDAARMSSSSGRSQIAEAIARGILQYVR